MEETLSKIAQMIESRSPGYIVTANLDFCAQAAQDVELQRILVEAELVVCDGTPLLWASRLTGQPLRERVAGSDMVPLIAARAAASGWKIFLLGGEPDSLQRAAENLKMRHPSIEICDTYSPPFARFHDMDHAEITRRVRETKPDILLVAFGCPKQEKWIYAHYRELGVPCSIGVGATIDFLAGKVRRAPSWVGKIGIEWLFRLAQEPRRLVSRYAHDFGFLISQMLRERHAIFQPPKLQDPRASQSGQEDEDFEVILWKGEIVAATVSQLGLPTYKKPFVVDLSRVSRIDSSGLGYLLKTLRRGWASGQPGCFSSPSAAVSNVLRVTRLDRVVPLADGLATAHHLLEREKASSYLRHIVDREEASMLVTLPTQVISANVSACAESVIGDWNARPELRLLQLDLGATTFIDSSGLGFLIRCFRLTEARTGSRLELLHVLPNVHNVIKVARLDKLLAVKS